MFHVSTMLPNDPKDEQRIERKRHIGNDICMIVFVEEDAVFDPSVVKSNFVHVIAAVKVVNAQKKKSNVRYELTIYSKASVTPVHPWLPSAPFHHDSSFSRALLTKCMCLLVVGGWWLVCVCVVLRCWLIDWLIG
jgi:RAP1 GTPase activating protein 1